MCYCSNCGYQNMTASGYCIKCGSPLISQQMAAVVYTPVNPCYMAAQARSESQSELSRMMEYFTKKRRLYEEYDECALKMLSLSRGVSQAPLGWGIVAFVGAFIGYIIYLRTCRYTALAEVKNLYLSLPLAFLLCGTALIVLRIVNGVRHSHNLDHYTRKTIELGEELTNHYNAYGKCSIGPEYTNPFIISKLMDRVNSGRAGSVKEAVNMLNGDARRIMPQADNLRSFMSGCQAEYGAPLTVATFYMSRYFNRY